MPYSFREFTCPRCGGPVTRRAPAGAEVYCILCAVWRSGENARQLRAKSGAFYEAWLAAMERSNAEAQVLAQLAAEIDRIELPADLRRDPTSPRPPG